MGIITSAAYIDQELAAEFGQMPPAFLPFGSKRLYEYQIEFLKRTCSLVYLTIPTSYEVLEIDNRILEELGVCILRVPDGFQLGESIAHAIILSQSATDITILHGDTHLPTLDQSIQDSVSIGLTEEDYRRGRLSAHEGTFPDNEVLSGWFRFSSAKQLLRCLSEAKWDFISALNAYDAHTPLRKNHQKLWLDFGHLLTYYQSRKHVSTARSFNHLTMLSRHVYKTGDNPDKLYREARWFTDLPAPLRIYAPTYMGRDAAGYHIAYEHSPTLQELLVFGNLGVKTWERIAAACFEFLNASHNSYLAKPVTLPKNVMQQLTTVKTKKRIATWLKESRIPIEREWHINGEKCPSIKQIIDSTAQVIDASEAQPSIMHGDLCFSNIFYDSRQRMIRVIDPRGSVDDKVPTIYGDLRYDLAKIAHSVHGYDEIIAGHFAYIENQPFDISLQFIGNHHSALEAFEKFSMNDLGINSRVIIAIVIQLFLSMIPLHADRPDRQSAFLANALNLYVKMEL